MISKSKIIELSQKKFSSQIEKFVTCMDLYHQVDNIQDTEESKFSLRNNLFVKIDSTKTKIPMSYRLNIQQWMHYPCEWEIAKREIV